ncbi:MAG: YwiC-like family protein [Acidimicrobiia bacterium]|nr:YwiC-like family protein [Acidimicrobiia bacterium]
MSDASASAPTSVPVGHGRPAVAWREVALPREHGGWSLTAEPAVLGLLAAWSGSGAALAAGAMVAFVARTPLKVVLVDRFRHRWLPRTALALRVALGELAVLAALATVATAGSGDRRFWVPLALAMPLVAVELWFDMRSRSRRLAPELAGAVGIGSVAAAIALAGGSPGRVAAGLWCVTAARAVAAIPYVRVQLARARSRPHRRWPSDLAQAGAVAAVAAAWAVDAVPLAAVAALALSGAVALVGLRFPIRPAPLIGAEQSVVGLTVVLVAGLATRLLLS